MKKTNYENMSNAKKMSLLELLKIKLDLYKDKKNIENYIMDQLHNGISCDILSNETGYSKGYIFSVCKRNNFVLYTSLIACEHRKKIMKHKKIY